jgi:RimJ/RimL family protein N-acetyltransferase
MNPPHHQDEARGDCDVPIADPSAVRRPRFYERRLADIEWPSRPPVYHGPMDLLDRLASERVRLRPLWTSDVADHVRWRNDAEVAYWATAGDVNYSPASPAAVERWFAEKLPTLDLRTGGILAVDLTNGRHIGMVDYRAVDSVAR